MADLKSKQLSNSRVCKWRLKKKLLKKYRMLKAAGEKWQYEHLTNKIPIPYVPFIVPVHTVALDCPIRPAKGGFTIDL